VVKDLFRTYSFVWVFAEHFNNNFLRILRNSAERNITHIGVAFFYQIESCFPVGALEGQLSANEGVVDDAGRPNVYLLFIPLLD